jgi:hypothetical protein
MAWITLQSDYRRLKEEVPLADLPGGDNSNRVLLYILAACAIGAAGVGVGHATAAKKARKG